MPVILGKNFEGDVGSGDEQVVLPEEQNDVDVLDGNIGDPVQSIGLENAPIEFPELPEITKIPSSERPEFFERLYPNLKIISVADDYAKAEIMEASFKDDERFGGIFKDKFGLPMIMWNEMPYYVNKPGISRQDVGGFFGEVLKYLPATKYVSSAKTALGTLGKGAVAYPLTEGFSKLAEATLAPKTVEERDASASDLGKEIGRLAAQDIAIDLAVPRVLKIGNKTIDLARKKTGSVTKEALEKSVTKPEIPNMTQEIINESRFPLLAGQRFSPIVRRRFDPMTAQLAREDVLRHSSTDDPAAKMIIDFDKKQLEAIQSEAAKLRDEMGSKFVGLEDMLKTIPQGVASKANEILSQLAKDKNLDAVAAMDALKTLKAETQPLFSRQAVTNLTQKMMDVVTKEEGLAPTLLSAGPVKTTYQQIAKLNKLSKNKKFKDKTLKNIEQIRNNLGEKIGAASNLMDKNPKRILTMMKGRMDESIDKSITDGLVSGDSQVIEDLRMAQGLFAEYFGLIGGKSIPALRRKPDVERAVKKTLYTISDGDRDVDQVVNILFGTNAALKSSSSSVNAMPFVIDELEKILPKNEFEEFKRLMRHGVLGSAFSGADGRVTRSAIVNKYDDIFRTGKGIIKKLFTEQEIKKIEKFKNDVLPTLVAELPKNPSSSGYLVAGYLERAGLHRIPQFGLSPEARLVRVGLEEGAKALSKRKRTKIAKDAVAAVIAERRAPLFTPSAQALVRDATRIETSPEDADLREIDKEQVINEIESLQQNENQNLPPMNYQFMPSTSANIDLFDDLPVQSAPSGINPALSPTLLPSEEDREIAMRMQQPGIAGLMV